MANPLTSFDRGALEGDPASTRSRPPTVRPRRGGLHPEKGLALTSRRSRLLSVPLWVRGLDRPLRATEPHRLVQPPSVPVAALDSEPATLLGHVDAAPSPLQEWKH